MAVGSFFSDLVEYSYELGQRALKERSPEAIKQSGQFLTTPAIARFMAQRSGNLEDGYRILEPAVGSGVLVCALIERILQESRPLEIWVDGFETDPALCKAAQEVFDQAAQQALQFGATIHWQIYERDFVLECAPQQQPALFPNFGPGPGAYDLILANPPYFKLNTHDPRAHLRVGLLSSHTNIYALFMAIGAQMLKPQGKACFIVPRSFCSGQYFTKFRQEFWATARPLSFHLFEARNDLFKQAEVLQENVIVTFERRRSGEMTAPADEAIQISASTRAVNLTQDQPTRRVSPDKFLYQRDGLFLFRLPTGALDEKILAAMDRWKDSLERLDLKVSTGPVVAFRAARHLRSPESLSANDIAPLLWMQNVRPYRIEWPAKDFQKPQGISTAQNAATLLTPKANYILTRRFSAKEDRRRIIAAPLFAHDFPGDFIGLENHLNYIHRVHGELSVPEMTGLTALFNSSLIDRYFRIANGNTQVNAAELRTLPLPPWKIIQRIGEQIIETPIEKIERIVFSTLWETGLLPEDLPILQETRIHMGKIEQAQEILLALGLPSAQQNEMSALTLLVLAQLSEDMAWGEAQPKAMRVHDILGEIKIRYQREYAENTRETIRRQALHQFEQAGLVIRNPNNPALATNSPRTHYTLTDMALAVIRSYQTENWPAARNDFLNSRGSLIETYLKSVEQNRVPIQIADGTQYHLSPGKHNQLQAKVIEEFGSRFAPGSRLLYLGDTARKALIFDLDGFQKLNLAPTVHGKLPDVVLYDETHNRLFLIEAVTSHGPVSPKRKCELEAMFAACTAERVYLSAFLDFKTFNKFAAEIAWETEVWIAQIPNHMIHYNGEKFLRPGEA